MKKTILKYSIFLLTILGCSNPPSNSTTELKSGKIELKFHIGDCLSFAVDSVSYGTAVVVDYSEDEGGVWYGLCFTNYLNKEYPNAKFVDTLSFYGRKIENRFVNKGYLIGLDIVFVNASCFIKNEEKFQLIGNIKLDVHNINTGSYSATNDYNSIINSFILGRETRKTPPDHYSEHSSNLNEFIPDEYFKVSNFIIN